MSEKIQKEDIKKVSKLIDWMEVEEKAKGEEKFFVEGEGLHLIKNLLRVDEGTIMGFYGYLEKMVETLIGEILGGEGKEMIKKDAGEKGKREAGALFEKVFKKRHEELNVKMGGGWDYICPEAFWVLVEEGFEWKWQRIFGKKIKLGFLKKISERAKMKIWGRIEGFLKPEIPIRLFLVQDKDGEMVRQKMLEAGAERELVEKILDGKLDIAETVLELTRKGVPGKVIDRLMIREEYLESLKKLYSNR